MIMDNARDQLPDDATLDALLAQGSWPPPRAEALARLRHSALRTLKFSIWRTRVSFTAAAAVIALVIAGALMFTLRNAAPPIAVNLPAPAPTPQLVVRDANLAERAILYSQYISPRPATAPTVVKKPPEVRPLKEPAQLQQVIHSLLTDASPSAVVKYLGLIEDPKTSRQALAALENVPPEFIDGLFLRLDDPLVSRRMAAARALGKIDGPLITQRLAQMIQRNENRREALAALVTSQGRDATRFIALASKEPTLASQIRVLRTELNNRS
jgi:hypothetical protein